MNIREAEINDSIGIARVHVDAWHETYKGLINDNYLNSLSYDEKAQKWRNNIKARTQTQKIFVLENESKDIVGFAFYGLNSQKEYEYDIDLHALYILKAYQNKGYGSKLMQAAVKELVNSGYNSLIIWALKDNAYCRFYEKLGGVKAGEQLYAYSEQEVKLTAYGWKDASSILK